MRTSVRWINDYLDPAATAEEQADLLTRAGLPYDGGGPVEDDVWQEIETTSNRGDCLCHVGLAREIAAMSGRRVKPPHAAPQATGPEASTMVSVRNEAPDLCPLYTARVILGAKVGPSPEWLAQRLRAVGQKPRNNIVDASNFVLFELGQPTHVFDLATLSGPRIVVRRAAEGESILPIGEGAAEVRLSARDLVIADAERPVAIAGVKGGAPTAVRDSTTDLLLEAATFSPLAVRSTSRRLRIASDSSYRFERGVHPAQVDAAAERLAQLILETAGGVLCQGSVRDGAPLPAPRRVVLRAQRCRDLLGIDLPTERMAQALAALGFDPQLRREGRQELLDCTVPPERLDVEREIDLVEEVARMAGMDTLPVADTISVRVGPPQPRIAARRALRDALAGLGFVETITHSLIGEAAAEPFTPPGAAALAVADERAGGTPILRPSIVPSLLRVRRVNLDNGVSPLSLFEIAPVFHRRGEGHREQETLAMIADQTQPEEGLRPLRGAVERVLRVLLGEETAVEVAPATDLAAGEFHPASWLDPDAAILLDGTLDRTNGHAAGANRAAANGRAAPRVVGRIGRVAAAVQSKFGLDVPVLAAEIYLDGLLDRYPPEPAAHALPAFPAIERDISAIVAESATWREMRSLLEGLELPMLEAVEFVTAFRGKPIPPGRKSVTARLRFRAPDRTLRREEVDLSVTKAMAELMQRLGAEIRA